MEVRAGVDFYSCIKFAGNSFCELCTPEKRRWCELFASLDLGYTDDPRNAAVDCPEYGEGE